MKTDPQPSIHSPLPNQTQTQPWTRIRKVSVPQSCETPWTTAHHVPLSTEFSRQEYWSGHLSFLQGIFVIQGLNPGFQHCGEILYHLKHQGSPTRVRPDGNPTSPVHPFIQQILELPRHQLGWPWTKAHPPPVFVNKALLEHSHSPPSVYVTIAFCCWQSSVKTETTWPPGLIYLLRSPL